MKIIVAGEGAFGRTHLDVIRNIPDIEVVALAGGDPERTRAVAARYGVPRWTTSLEDALAETDVEAAILATPSPLHAAQAMLCLESGKHVEVEIPLALSLPDAEAVARVAAERGAIAMCGHTRRFNPSHRWVRRRLRAGDLRLHHLEVQTHFMRRQNVNARGEPRNWVDHLLWHHAAHTVDLFQHQTGETCSVARGVRGPTHPILGIAMDMAIQLKVPSGAICSLSLSFNNDGPIGSWFRYICDRGAYDARYDELVDGEGHKIDLSSEGAPASGVELQDREFFDAIRAHREPNASVAQVLATYNTLDRIEGGLQ